MLELALVSNLFFLGGRVRDALISMGVLTCILSLRGNAVIQEGVRF